MANSNRRSIEVFNIDSNSLASFEFTFRQTLTNESSLPYFSKGYTYLFMERDTQSITDSVLAYREENGRTYHAYKDGWYFLPNDQEEVERLRLCHDIFRRAMGNKTHFTPWTRTYYPRRVLDVGTGTGDWCFDFAEEFPQTELVIGTDLSNIQPEEAPPNVCFVIDDSAEDWQDSDLDFVHTRNTNGCWEDMNAQVVRQAYDRLNPGGWLETQEVDIGLHCDDGTMPADHGLQLFLEELDRLSRAANKPCAITPQLRGWFEDAGFVDIQERVIRLPTCAWPDDPEQKEIGLWMEEMFSGGISAISRAYQSRIVGLSIEEHELSLIPVRRDLRNRNYHTYINLYVVWGRKPGSNLDRYNLKIPEATAEAEQDEVTEG